MDLLFGSPPSGFFGWFGNKVPSDYVNGAIVRATGKNGEPQKGDEVLSRIGGTWLGCVEWDDKMYWDLKTDPKKYTLLDVDDPLPSDCRFRQDLIYLQRKDEVNAQM